MKIKKSVAVNFCRGEREGILASQTPGLWNKALVWLYVPIGKFWKPKVSPHHRNCTGSSPEQSRLGPNIPSLHQQVPKRIGQRRGSNIFLSVYLILTSVLSISGCKMLATISAMLYVLQARTIVLLQSRVEETSAMMAKHIGPIVCFPTQTKISISTYSVPISCLWIVLTRS